MLWGDARPSQPLGLRDAERLRAFEEEIVKQRAGESLPAGALSVTRYRAIHRHLFQNVYPWAGRFRTVRIAKGESQFAYPERVPLGMRRLFAGLRESDGLKGLSHADFARGAAHFRAELNALHPVRDGNGRTQLTFLALVASRARHPLRLERLEAARFLDAMIASFLGDERRLEEELRLLAD